MRAVVLLVFIVPGAMAAPSFWAAVPDLPGPGPGDEGFAIDPDGTNMTGWTVTDGEGTLRLPSMVGTDRMWFAGDLVRWEPFGLPDPWEWNATGLRLANNGDDLFLVDPNGTVMDEVAWGPGTALAHIPEAVMFRQVDGEWVTPRIHRIGQSELDRPTFEVDSVIAYLLPDAGFEVLTGLIHDAERRIHLHVHDLQHPFLVQELVDAMVQRPWLDGQVLVDDRVVGQDARERSSVAWQLDDLHRAGFDVVTAGGGRYAHHHLKVLIADDAVAIQSENWNAGGVPVDPSWGNRGWGIVLHGEAVADWFASWMGEDREAWDVSAPEPPRRERPPELPIPRGGHQVVPPLTVQGPIMVTPIVSPDHTADPITDPLRIAMATASERIWTQHLSMDVHESNRLGWERSDRWIDALVEAHARELDVQVQLAAPFAFDDTRNHDTATHLRAQGIDARQWDHPRLATLHNKGWIIDDAVVIGSMNAHHASRSANREASVLVDHPEVATYFAEAFQRDREAMQRWSLPVAPVPMLLVVMGVGAACRTRHAVIHLHPGIGRHRRRALPGVQQALPGDGGDGGGQLRGPHPQCLQRQRRHLPWRRGV